MGSAAADSYRARVEIEDAVMTTARKMGAELDKLAKKFDNLERASKLGGKGGAAAGTVAAQVKQINTVANAQIAAQRKVAAQAAIQQVATARSAARGQQQIQSATVRAQSQARKQQDADARAMIAIHARTAQMAKQKAKDDAQRYPAGNANWFQRAQSSIINFNQALDKQQKNTNRSMIALAGLKSKFMAVVPGARGLSNAINSIKTRAIDDLRQGVGILARSILRVAFWATAAAVGTAFTLSAKSAISASVAYETASKSFESMLGSKQKADEMMRWSKEFAKTTPFQWPEVIEGARLQTAFGLDPREYLKIAGDISSAMGQGAEGALRVSEALGRIKAGQFGEAFEQLRRFGIGQERLRNAGVKFTKGGSPIGSSQGVLDAIKKIASQAPYVNQMNIAMGTMAGMWSNIKDQIWAISLEVGQRMTPGIKRFLNLLKGGIENFTKSAAYNRLLAFIDTAFSQKTIDNAYNRFLLLVANVEAGITIMSRGFRGVSDFIKTGFISDESMRGLAAKLSLMVAGVMTVAAAWHMVAFAAHLATFAVTKLPTELLAAAGSLGMAMASAGGVGIAGGAYKEFSKPADEYFGGRAAEIRKRLRDSERNMANMPGGYTPRGQKIIDTLKRQRLENYAAWDIAKKAEKGGANAPKTYKQLVEENLSQLKGSGVQDPLVAAIQANTAVTQDNTAVQETAAQRLEGIVQQIIGGGELARLGIAPADVARRRGYTDAVYSKGSGAQKAVSVELSSSSLNKLNAAIRDTFEDLLAQTLSGIRSHSTARTSP